MAQDVLEKADMNSQLATRKVFIEIPQYIHEDQSFFQEAIAALLYNKGTLTLKEARLLIGKNRREFEEDVLPRYGFTTDGGTAEEIEMELNA